MSLIYSPKPPLISPEVDQSHEGNEVDNTREEEKEVYVEDVQEEEDMEVNLDLPPNFDEYEDDEGACEVLKEEAIEQEKEKEVADCLEEVEVKTDESEMLSLSTSYPQKNHEHLSLFLTSGELLPKVSKFEIGDCKEWVQPKSEGSPSNHIQIGVGNEWKGAFKTKKDLFKWLVLFQPNHVLKI